VPLQYSYTSTPLSACTVQLYLYSPQCLYSTAIPLLPSLPVQWCTLSLLCYSICVFHPSERSFLIAGNFATSFQQMSVNSTRRKEKFILIQTLVLSRCRYIQLPSFLLSSFPLTIHTPFRLNQRFATFNLRDPKIATIV